MEISRHFQRFPIVAHYLRSFPATSGRHDVISGRYTTVLWRYDDISGVSLLSPTTSGHFRPLPVVVTSFPADVRLFHGGMTSFPVFPYYRSPLPVAMTSLPVETTSCGVAGAKRERA